ncbi:hypothetical protein KAJ27_03490 [bacterium]|nr:hypothetical protein [bacterium]
MFYRCKNKKYILFIFILIFNLSIEHVFSYDIEKKNNDVKITINSKGKILNSITDSRYRKSLFKTIRDIEFKTPEQIIVATWGNGVYILDADLNIKKRYFTYETANALYMMPEKNEELNFLVGGKGAIGIYSKKNTEKIVRTRSLRQGGIYHDICYKKPYGILAGSTGKGIYIFSDSGKYKNNIENPLETLWINSLKIDPPEWFLKKYLKNPDSDYILVGGNKGIEIYDLKNNATFPIKNINGFVNSIRFSSHKAVVTTTNKGIFLYYYSRWIHFSKNSGLNGINIFDAAICGDRIYLATEKGLFYINYIQDDCSKKVIPEFTEETRIIYPYGNDLIIGTKNGRVAIFSPKDGKIIKEINF